MGMFFICWTPSVVWNTICNWRFKGCCYLFISRSFLLAVHMAIWSWSWRWWWLIGQVFCVKLKYDLNNGLSHQTFCAYYWLQSNELCTCFIASFIYVGPAAFLQLKLVPKSIEFFLVLPCYQQFFNMYRIYIYNMSTCHSSGTSWNLVLQTKSDYKYNLIISHVYHSICNTYMYIIYINIYIYM